MEWGFYFGAIPVVCLFSVFLQLCDPTDKLHLHTVMVKAAKSKEKMKFAAKVALKMAAGKGKQSSRASQLRRRLKRLRCQMEN